MPNIIDPEKLENKIYGADQSFVSACPACRHEGRDRTGNHLKVYPNGAYGCVVDDSKEHDILILQLAGTESDGSGVAPSNYEPPPLKIQMAKSWSVEILGGLFKDYSYFEGRGISAETQRFFRMGVANKGQMNNRVVIPIFDPQERQIIGFSGRLIKDKDEWYVRNKIPKWKHLGDKDLFNWPYFSKIKGSYIILVESPGDVLYLWEQGIKNTICLFGTNISSKIISHLICLNPRKILISTNNEPGNNFIGNKSAEKIKGKLIQFFSPDKVQIALPPTKDFNDLYGLTNGGQLLREWEERYLRKTVDIVEKI
jgi:hypothetical protein